MLPVCLVFWARAAGGNVPLPVPWSPPVGWFLAAAGISLWTAGIIAILQFGGGMPMNAYPPSLYVERGAFALLRHPIYTGFTLASFGVSIAQSSAAGFWLVTPMLVLGCVSLILGYEAPDRDRRFGPLSRLPWISIPTGDDSDPGALRRLGAAAVVFLPWIFTYEALAAIAPRDGLPVFLPFERRWPVLEWTELFYGSTYLFVLAAPFVARRSRDVRAFVVGGLLATAIVGLCFLLLPITAPPRPFAAGSLLGRVLLIERARDVAGNAFPSFHVVWALLAARAWGSRGPEARAGAYVLATAIAASCVTTGMHGVLDVAAAVLVFSAIGSAAGLWEFLRRSAERVANSWRAWNLGRYRLLNHAFIAAACGFVFLTVAGALYGPPVGPVLIVAVGGVLCAALGAQWIEGSSKLSRPYGYFGGLAGIGAGCAIAAALWPISGLRLAAAFTVAAPWVVVIGRLRCLIQGCCHGAPARAGIGISCLNPMSRVVRLSDLGGVPIHPTPLYSILWNLLIGVLLVRLWTLHVPASFVVGAYFLLSGIGRFAEEAYRGEPQTPHAAGLRLYQWFALAQVILGAFLTTLPSESIGNVLPSGSVFLAAGAFALFSAIVYGVDAPGSNVRFARLA